jgi:hypothetical protein
MALPLFSEMTIPQKINRHVFLMTPSRRKPDVPFLPNSGHLLFWQQNFSIGRMDLSSKANPLNLNRISPCYTMRTVIQEHKANSDTKLFLVVHRNDRLFLLQGLRDLRIDVFELGVPVRVLIAFQRLLVVLKAISQLVQQSPTNALADGMSLPLQLRGQNADALARPPERRFRIAACHGFDQSSRVGNQSGIGVYRLLAAGARGADPGDVKWMAGGNFSLFLRDGRTR